jgi:hypothetical protein
METLNSMAISPSTTARMGPRTAPMKVDVKMEKRAKSFFHMGQF